MEPIAGSFFIFVQIKYVPVIDCCMAVCVNRQNSIDDHPVTFATNHHDTNRNRNIGIWDHKPPNSYGIVNIPFGTSVFSNSNWIIQKRRNIFQDFF